MLWLYFFCCRKIFNEKTRRTEVPSTLKVEGTTIAAIPPGTEAALVVLYENAYKRWLELYKWRHVEDEGNNRKLKRKFPVYSSKHAETFRFKGKWSDNCGGSSKKGSKKEKASTEMVYCSWDAEGTDKFEDLKEQIQKNREDNLEEIVKVEEAIREKLEKRNDEKLANNQEDTEAYKAKVEEAKRKREEKERKRGRKRRRVTIED